MRLTLTIDDDLLEKARESSGISESEALVRTALQQFVRREAARRLAQRAGTMPDLDYIPQRRSGAE